MADTDFERRLERMFGEAAELADAQAFTARVEARLNTGWTARRWLIGAAGVVGGLIAASQLLVSNLFHRADALEGSIRAVSGQVALAVTRTEWLSTLAGGGGVMVWVASALALVALGYALSRVIEEI